MIYVPTRGEILHWGATEGSSGNSVLAFSAKTLSWKEDQPSDPKTEPSLQGTRGHGQINKFGRPMAAVVGNGGIYDTKRDRLVYTMRGLMTAYDPKSKSWTDLKAKTVFPSPVYDHDWNKSQVSMKAEIPGGPPVYGVGACYDPLNDEILIFPHFDAKNTLLREATGQISGHYGTFRYRCDENIWRPVSDTFGSPEIRELRTQAIAIMADVSRVQDQAWILRKKPDAKASAELAKQLRTTIASLEKSAVAEINTAREQLQKTAALLDENKLDETLPLLGGTLWQLNDWLNTRLRVEPPARCAAPMVYSPKHKSIVLFGGQTSIARTDLENVPPLASTALGDTWIYDCATRQWRELNTPHHPGGERIPLLAYDPKSGLVLLVTIHAEKPTGKAPGAAKPENIVSLWTLDLDKGDWLLRNSQTWPGPIATRSGQGSEGPKSNMPAAMLGFDPETKTLVICQPEKEGQTTYTMRLDLEKLPDSVTPSPAPQLPAIIPYQAAPDDPAWIAKLKSLPANTWVAAKPPREPVQRDWGITAVDPVRGWIVYFGGGHSSYQCNDVAVYPVGANRWSRGAGDHNAFVPPNEWEGSTLGHLGGPATGHQRNTYQAFDGRLYLVAGTNDLLPSNYVFHAEEEYVRFYDIDRGGVWRETKFDKITRPDNIPPIKAVNMTDPRGRLLTLQQIAPYNYAPNVSRTLVRIFDANDNSFKVLEFPKPFPEQKMLGEGRPFCYLPDRDQILFMNAKPADATRAFVEDPKKSPLEQTTFLFDLKTTTVRELPAKNRPPVKPVQCVEYVPAQRALLAIIGDEMWAYSFDKETWARFPTVAEDAKTTIRFQKPYGQMVWVEKYGVLINLYPTSVMRPDFSQIEWGK